MSTTPYIDDTGFHAPDYATIHADTMRKFKDIYGEDTYLEPDSQDGSLIAVASLSKYDTILAAEQTYRSFSPRTARGDALSSNVKINGIGRAVESYSTVPVRCVGQIGTVIENGMVGGDDGVKWLFPARVVIPPTGECEVVATASEPGDIRAAPGDIYRILTPTKGWQDAHNVVAATAGAPVEEDGTLRQRQTISTALPSLTVLDGTIGAVANVKGVTRCREYENDTHLFDANGLPPHSIAIVVQGGEPADIAHAIFIKKTPGTGTFGTTEVVTADSYGVPSVIRFFRPTVFTVRAQIRIKAYYGYMAETELRIKETVAAYINSMRIGMDVLRSRLICPITSAEVLENGRTFDVEIDNLLLAADGEALRPDNVLIPFNGMAATEPDYITVVVEKEQNAGS